MNNIAYGTMGYNKCAEQENSILYYGSCPATFQIEYCEMPARYDFNGDNILDPCYEVNAVRDAEEAVLSQEKRCGWFYESALPDAAGTSPGTSPGPSGFGGQLVNPPAAGDPGMPPLPPPSTAPGFNPTFVPPPPPKAFSAPPVTNGTAVPPCP